MIHIVVNGLIVEAETVTEVHLQMEVKRYQIQRPRLEAKRVRKAEEESPLTDIFRELYNEIERRKH